MERSTTSGVLARLRRAVPALSALAIAWAVARVLRHVVWLVRSCPEGSLRPLLFLVAAALLIPAPGLALRRLEKPGGGPARQTLYVLACGFAASSAALWFLLLAGLLGRASLMALLALWAAAGAWGIAPLLRPAAMRRIPRDLASAWLARPAVSRVAWALGALVLAGLFEASAGTPFTAWDAAVSWDKWATIWAGRRSLGGCLVGGYPQMLPIFSSVFYRLAGSVAEAVPVEQMLLHGLHVLFPAMLMLALGCAGRRFGFPGSVAFAVFAASRYVFGDFAIGQVDIPLTAMLAALIALAPEPGRPAGFTSAALLFFAVYFLKGTGLVWVVFALAVRIAVGRSWRRETGAFLVALLMALPFAAHQILLSLHPERIEHGPFLHALPLKAAHVSMFHPNLAHALDWWNRTLVDRAIPDRWSAVAAAAAVALVALAFIRRRSRVPAAIAAATLVAWFFAGSYDLRNAEPALCFAAAAFAALLPPTPRDRPHAAAIGWLRTLIAAGALLVLSLPGLSGAAASSVAATFRPPARHRAWTMPAGHRHQAFRPAGDLVNVLAEAPCGRQARHILAGDSLYRLFGARGVYAIQLNAYDDGAPGDVFLRAPAWMKPPRKPFLRAAVVRGAGPYREMWLREPALRPVAFDFAEDVLRVADAPSAGLLEVNLRPGAAPDASLRLAPKDAPLDPFARYLHCIRDESRLRLVYWTPGVSPAFSLVGAIPDSCRLVAFPESRRNSGH